MIKAVETNDLIDKSKKSEFKKMKLDELDFHGITFCK